MPKPTPEEAPITVPEWDETKLANTKFDRLLRLRNEELALAQPHLDKMESYQNQISALMLKYKIDAVRIDGYTPRWVKEGKPGKKFDYQKALEILKVPPKTLDRCFTETKPRASYFQIYAPKGEKGEQE